MRKNMTRKKISTLCTPKEKMTLSKLRHYPQEPNSTRVSNVDVDITK